MTTTSATMATALNNVLACLPTPRRDGVSLGSWRWTLRQRMTAVRDALVLETGGSSDGWLAARGGAAFRERNTLLQRLADLSVRALEDADVGAVRTEVARLVNDISHHVQRVHDIVYDEVELELGGSE